MIHFPVLRTRRLTVQLRELSLSESIAIAAMPVQLEEAACTKFLRCAIKSSKESNGINDPAHWTVQERMLAVCHYLAAVVEDGPDFSISGGGRYSDYLDGEIDIPLSVTMIDVGEVGGDAWSVRHLTGAMAESIERIDGEVDGVSGRLHWLLGAMAAQMVRAGETVPDITEGEGAFDEYMVERMRVLAEFPESDFIDLMNRFFGARKRLRHLFQVEFSADGLVAEPKGGAASDLPPARFPVRSCLSPFACSMVGKSDESGRKPLPILEHVTE